MYVEEETCKICILTITSKLSIGSKYNDREKYLEVYDKK